MKHRTEHRTGPSLRLRSHRILLLAALVGVATGLVVAGFEYVSRTVMFDRLLKAPIGVQAVALVVGLVIAALSLRYVAAGASPSTSDEYIRNIHEPERSLALRPVFGRFLAGVATLGSGGALGYEGPSIYVGAALGSAIQARRPKWFGRSDSKVLMAAGAAAGVAAIFKAPATGAIFALEVPYRDDTARHLLLPALVGAAAGYLTFVAVLGTDPLFRVDGSPPFGMSELGGAAVLGLLCGIGARLFAKMTGAAKKIAGSVAPLYRVAGAGLALAGLLLASKAIEGEGLATGSGYRTIAWVTQPGHGIPLVLALLAFRVGAVAATLAGGGVGGLFVPLVITGALIGDIGAIAIGDHTNLFPLIGIAAFLGAGYRTPLAAVVFVAEATGRPGFIVPGLIASVVSQLVMGDVSVSPYQTSGARGHLERRFRLPVTSAIRSDVLGVPADATLREFWEDHLLLTREPEVPVLDGDRYLGMVTSQDLAGYAPETWDDVVVREMAHKDWPSIGPAARLEDALRAMEAADVEALPVLDASGGFVGMVSTTDIIRLDEILGSTDRS